MSDHDSLDFSRTTFDFAAGKKVFNRYTLTRIVGRGGMGVVWLARDEELRRDAALKFLPDVLAANEEAVADLKDEIVRNLELAHPNIVRINDFETDGRSVAISMEFVDGPTLASLKLQRPGRCFGVEELSPWVKQLCAALDYAHAEARIVHRDLKPANLMVNSRGQLKVTDFGIARNLSDSVSRVSQREGTSGTPYYMSPQQMRGRNPSATDDVYSLGATLYELLTGKPPFYTGDVLLQAEQETAPSMAERRKELEIAGGPIPREWEETIAACLAKEAKDRPQSAGEVARRLGAGAADGGNAQRSTLNAQRSSGDQGVAPAKVEREVPTAFARSSDHAVEKKPSTPRGPLWSGLAAAVILLAGGGYYFGVHAPEQARQAEVAEAARLEADASARRAAAKAPEQAPLPASVSVRPPRLYLQAGQTWTIPDLNLTMMPIAAGTFKMGDASSSESDEKPVTQVTIMQPYWLGKTEVTQGEWEAVMGSNPSNFKGANLPVERVSWEEAMEFCRKLTERERRAGQLPEGYSYTLPTEAQWEYACRAGTTGDYAGELSAMGWYHQNGGSNTNPVGTKRANAWGLHDMHGNVWEWCADWYAGYAGGTVRDPLGPSSGSNRVRRGGSWFNSADDCRSAHRLNLDSGYRNYSLGFRLALSSTPVAVLERRALPITGQAWTIPDLNLTMMPIAAGTFRMGDAGSSERDEKPVTQVTISKPYWLGKTEVTQGEWEGLMGSKPPKFKGANLPVETISWTEAMEFCAKLTERERAAGRLPEGYVYRLPTEAQWEYACRAGTTGDYAGELSAMGWYDQNSSDSTNPVGTKRANAWGLHDMHGNVWELCADWHGGYPGGSVRDPVGPVGPSSGSGRVGRGGAYFNTADQCRSALRYDGGPVTSEFALGFRLALSSVP